MQIPLYHITHVDTLPEILNLGSLICKKLVNSLNFQPPDISHRQIQDRRAKYQVPCEPGGTLHDYVPFYFAPRSPMLYTIHRGNIQGIQSQADIIYLVTITDQIQQLGQPFVFTDGHAIMDYSSFYTDLRDLEFVIDWEVMQAQYWSNTEEDPDRKRRRQAEFLVHRFVPWSHITEIGVMNQSVQQNVVEMIAQSSRSTPPVLEDV